jgi:uncharacterized membrane protein YjjB (DUF3815 family)
MPLLKTFLLSFAITSIIFILIMKYIFNENGHQYIWIGLISGIGAALVLVFATKRNLDKKI